MLRGASMVCVGSNLGFTILRILLGCYNVVYVFMIYNNQVLITKVNIAMLV